MYQTMQISKLELAGIIVHICIKSCASLAQLIVIIGFACKVSRARSHLAMEYSADGFLWNPFENLGGLFAVVFGICISQALHHFPIRNCAGVSSMILRQPNSVQFKYVAPLLVQFQICPPSLVQSWRSRFLFVYF